MSKRPTILLAEDEPGDVFLVQRALRIAAIAHHLVVVRDGREALAYFAGEGRFCERDKYPLPHLVLLDLDMPIVSGFEVLARLRQQPSFQEVPIVVFTASSLSPDVSRVYRLGANSFLTKPSRLSNLSAALKELIHFFVEKPLARELPADGPEPHTVGYGDVR